MISGFVREAVAKALGIEASDLDSCRSLLRLGLDSLMAIELKEAFVRDLGVEIDLKRVLEGASAEDLATAAAEGFGAPADPAEHPLDATEARNLLGRLDEMRDDERERLIDQLLRAP